MVSGGTAPYSYAWADGITTSDRLQEIGKGNHAVTVTDFNSCILNASYDLTDPDPVAIDLPEAEYLCTGQTVMLDAGNPGSTYQWLSTNGFTSEDQAVFVSETGTYTVTVTTAAGCTGTDSFQLVVDANILQADFISTTEAMVGDTLVLINITFPIGDSAYWNFGTSAAVLRNSFFVQEVVFSSPGTYPVTLNVTKGECFDQVTRDITILERTEGRPDDDPGGRMANNLITSFDAYPNPSNGKFTIAILMRESSPVDLRIYSIDGGRPWATYTSKDADRYEINAELQVPSGVYYILLNAGSDKQIKRILIY